MNRWEHAILNACASTTGAVSNQEIYDLVKGSISLSEEHLRPSVYGGRPAYVHQVRSHITNLSQSGDLRRVRRGLYELTAHGKGRLSP